MLETNDEEKLVQWTFSHHSLMGKSFFNLFSELVFPSLLMFYFEPFSLFVSICVSVGPYSETKLIVPCLTNLLVMIMS